MGRGPAGAEGQARGSITKSFTRLDQGPTSLLQSWSRGSPAQEGGTQRSARRGGTGDWGRRDLDKTGGDASSRLGARGQRGGVTLAARGSDQLSGRQDHQDCGRSASTAGTDRGCSSSARRTSQPPFLWSRGWVSPLV